MPTSTSSSKSVQNPTQTISEVELLSLRCEADAAKFLAVSPRTLQSWRQTGDGPRFVKNGRSVGYRLKDLIDYTESRIRSHTSEKAVADARTK